ncbi:MAG: hypothetical protein QOC81_4181 [Thermoanaerobaculia bacterium]|jgi:hypothetical protein|nr:hypothetical protein [Thermoanaerobaculia bacterium]
MNWINTSRGETWIGDSTLEALDEIVGKTIAKAEITPDRDDTRNPSQRLVLAFGDRTSVEVVIGGNFGMMITEEPITTDLMLFMTRE